MRLIFILLIGSLCSFALGARTVVADFETHEALQNASVFDSKGNFLGVSDSHGRLPFCQSNDFPLTVRYLGYDEETVGSNGIDTVFMHEYAMELGEIVVESKKHSVLHMLAYVREYSTLSTLTDTVNLFREKMVDFMKPVLAKSKFRGWSTPRVLNARSYYQFTNNQGLDSVSDRCNHHFSWMDWMGLPPSSRLPSSICDKESATDTVRGKYSFTELWHKNKEKVTLDADILADTASRKWVPHLAGFFRNDTDFERINIKYNFDNVSGPSFDETNITGYSFNIESKGRGRGMFMFNRRDEAFYVTTYCEVYIIDKEYITEKEAKRWEKDLSASEEIGFFIPREAPELQPSVIDLIARVDDIDHRLTRLGSMPDLSNIGYRAERVSPGQQVLRRLKGIFGIDRLVAKRKMKKNYNEFRRNQQKRNRKI